jgi:hypothetical protein
MIGCNKRTKEAIISSTPVNYELGGSSDVMKSAVVFRPSRLPLDTLKSCLQWEASDALSISLKGSLDTPQDIIQEASKCAPEVLLGLLETKGEYVVTPSAEWTGFDYDSVVTLLRAWESAGIVKSISPSEGDARWSLTEHGTTLVESGISVTVSRPLLRPRDLSLEELSVFELVLKLEDAGWICKVALDKETKALARGLPPSWVCGLCVPGILM